MEDGDCFSRFVCADLFQLRPPLSGGKGGSHRECAFLMEIYDLCLGRKRGIREP